MKKLLFAILLVTLALCQQTMAETLNISYVRSPFNLQMMVMKEQGLLENEMAKQNVDVKWHEITSGAKQAQALASGDLQIGGVMNTSSVMMANAAGNPIRIIAGVSRPTDTFAIVGKKGGPQLITDLKGKKVAGPKGTVLHQTLVAALVSKGMTMNDIQFVQMGVPQAFAALQTGQVDTALLAAGFVINAEKEGAKILTTATNLTVPKLVMTTTEAVAEKHPNWIKAARSAHDQAAEWINNNKEESIALGAKLQKITIEDAEKLYSWAHFTQRLNQKDLVSLEEDMKFMLDNGMMRQKTDIKRIILPEALDN
jgi:NitT/TauT family transport system substrate-binding protein/sulfonate transport system substrate-binding protein